MLPKVIGHRGAAALAPENTLAGFRKAAELGCTWVEFDVRLTADDQLAVIHDSTVDRTTAGSGLVRAMSLAQVTMLDAGSPFHPDFREERVPSLSQTIMELAHLDLSANIEIKCDPGDAEAAADVLVRLLDREWQAASPPLISSFRHKALFAVHERDRSLPTGVLVRTLQEDWRSPMDRLGAATLHVGDRGLTEADLAGAASDGHEIGVYTINAGARARTVLDWGATGVFTDRPDLVFPT